jgi:hypothetical protein
MRLQILRVKRVIILMDRKPGWFNRADILRASEDVPPERL